MDRFEEKARELPNAEGFWWAKWRIKSPGTAEENDPPGNEWEVMHVVENTLDKTDEEHLMVMVPGVEKWQSLENFHWGPQAVRATALREAHRAGQEDMRERAAVSLEDSADCYSHLIETIRALPITDPK